MVSDILIDIHDSILDILDQIEPEDTYPEQPIIISWRYADSPMRFTLLIHESLPEEVDYLESNTPH